MSEKYIAIASCVLGGKRYEKGDVLKSGVKPNHHFKNAKTGEVIANPVKPKKGGENVSISFDEAVKSIEAKNSAEVEALKKEIEGLKADVESLESVGSSCATHLVEVREELTKEVEALKSKIEELTPKKDTGTKQAVEPKKK
jgi:ElaB/YqjD/DUF883 family membrane-anchored ribosome-binding protein